MTRATACVWLFTLHLSSLTGSGYSYRRADVGSACALIRFHAVNIVTIDRIHLGDYLSREWSRRAWWR